MKGARKNQRINDERGETMLCMQLGSSDNSVGRVLTLNSGDILALYFYNLEDMYHHLFSKPNNTVQIRTACYR